MVKWAFMREFALQVRYTGGMKTLAAILAALAIAFAGLVVYETASVLEQGRAAFLASSRSQLPSLQRVPLETDDDPASGAADAPVHIVEFGDFQCPFCAQAAPDLARIRAEYPGIIRFQYRDFPVMSSHPDAVAAAMAGECAQDAGKFFEYHDALFADQSDLSVQGLKRAAAAVGIPAPAFAECLDTERYRNEVLNDFDEGQQLGVTGTPTFFINGSRVAGVITYDMWKRVMEGVVRAGK